jgi:energy-coupling factor transporter transmembrane protein EcfT
LTETAVRVQVILTLVFIAVIPWCVSFVPSLAQSEALTIMTRERVVTGKVRATTDDVAAGLAAKAGEQIIKTKVIEPVSVYFEEGVARIDLQDLNSPKTGKGLFRAEVYLVSLMGFDVQDFSPAQLMTTRYVVDALLPIVILVLVSLLTQPTDPKRLARFYVRLKTPVAATLADDAVEVEKSYANPTRYDHLKLFPHTNLEFTKWDRQDTIGFLGCCALVGFILVFFKFVLTVGA